MLFSSLTFLLGFLPLTLLLTWLISRNFKREITLLWLIIASFVFYSWLFPPYLGLLAGSILFNYGVGQSLARYKDLRLMWIGVLANLGLLAWFKYAGFFADTFNALSQGSLDFGAILLPLAISFFTFQQIAYLVDMYRRDISAGGFLEYTFFVTFFPQLIAGPIVHYRTIIPQLKTPDFVKFRADDLLAGGLLFAMGLSKKVLIADRLRGGADALFLATANGVEPSFFESWVGMMCYAFQIYFDFSGYSDMALGLGRMFGLKLPKNFESPYKCRNIIDFWRRWNITLSHFLRDYLYFALGGNRRGKIMRYVNLFIVMLLGGLWHGAGWTFVVWGALHGAYLTVNHMWRNYIGRTLPVFVALPLTFMAVLAAWVFFRADSFDQAFIILQSMLGLRQVAFTDLSIYTHVFWLPVGLLLASILTWGLPNALQLVNGYESGRYSARRKTCVLLGTSTLLVLSIFTVYSSGTYEFLYFQF